MIMVEHWLVLGASSSIARAFVRTVAEQGAVITVAGRDIADLEATAADAKLRGASATRVLHCDVTDHDSRMACAAQAHVADTQLNVLLAIGTMPDHEAMQKESELLMSMIQSTYAGPVVLLEAIAPYLIAQKGGSVVIIGSVAGDRGRLKNYLYGSAKSGLGTYADGLRARLFRSGATVTLVKPGFIDTSMTWGLPGLFLVAAPQDCANAILKAAKRGVAVLYFPFFWRPIMLIIQHVPAFIMKRLSF